MDSPASQTLTLVLTAVIVAVKDSEAKLLTLDAEVPSLPLGAFLAEDHRTLELALRSWVTEQTGLRLGYVEQLYTFGNRHRDSASATSKNRVITVSYLALVGPTSKPVDQKAVWTTWYDFLPWEDHRRGRPALIDQDILPALWQWAGQALTPEEVQERQERIAIAFGQGHLPWDNEKVIQRYELLYEAGLVQESQRDWEVYGLEERFKLPITQNRMEAPDLRATAQKLGRPMDQDHRRILASSIGRLRGKLKYRPVVFELLPEEFTLLKIQKVVEALSGIPLHKQNFRRLLIQGGLVKETGRFDTSQPGRPAELFRFRRNVLQERPAPGIGLPQSRL